MGSDSERIFYPRGPRFVLRTPVLIQLPEGTVKGRSLDVSDTGMAAVFQQRMDVWIAGRLSVFARTGEWHVSLNVRVARAEGRGAGLNFQIANDADRIAIQKLMDYAIQLGAPPYGDRPPEVVP